MEFHDVLVFVDNSLEASARLTGPGLAREKGRQV
jgi:hypothetical protein